uniref:NodB homology domain-containing protein n=1 Tax=Steinernema glaseri TaxID=37863 RepID=A0A1I7Y6I6_9BILA
MDSVPYAFCLDVIGCLGAHGKNYDCSWNCKIMEEWLTGRWKAAVRSYTDKVQDITVGFKCIDGQWSYSTNIDKTNKGKSLDELLAMNRRFVRCDHIGVHSGIHPIGYHTTCPKEEIFTRLIPFLVQQSRFYRRLWFDEGLSSQDARVYFDLFLSCRGFEFRDLHLPYFGPETVEFLSACLEHNIKYLTLTTSWPWSQALEEIIRKYLNVGTGQHFDVFTEEDDESGESFMCPSILKIIFDAWDKVDNYFEFSTPWCGDLEPMLSIPLPPDVTRTQGKMMDENTSVVLWSKENGSVLSCSVSWGSNGCHYMEFTSRDKWWREFLNAGILNIWSS